MGENGPVSLTVDGKHRLEERLKQRNADFENAKRDLENASDVSDIRAADERKRRIKTQMNEIERTLPTASSSKADPNSKNAWKS